MSSNRQKPNKFVEFLNGKGFYIILILCVAAVGISGYVLFFGGDDTTEQDLLSAIPPASSTAPNVGSEPNGEPYHSLGIEPSSETLTTAIPDGAIRDSEVVMSTPSDPAETSSGTETTVVTGTADGSEMPDAGEPDGAVAVAGGADIADTEPETSTETKRPTASFFVWPLGGEVMMPFSIDELVFSNTMSDWRVHTGADIAGSLGALVCAAGAGVVEDVYTDEMMGTTVVIDHGNSVRTVYRNLDETVKVAIGDEVAAGDTIGAVGATADAESADTPHLHFEVIEAGAQIDPLSILP